MSERVYPDTVAGPYEPPPRTFEDRENREIRVHDHGEHDEVTEPFESLVEMYLAFDSEDRAQGIPPVEETQIRTWLSTVLDEECINVVAWDDGSAVGHATLVPDGTGASELAIFVLSAYQNAGIGTRLIESLLGAGRAAGVEHVWLTVERWNSPAVALYKKVGFEPCETGGFELEMSARLYTDSTGSEA
jgi:GNAT superfamily N-acetyltransferase